MKRRLAISMLKTIIILYRQYIEPVGAIAYVVGLTEVNIFLILAVLRILNVNIPLIVTFQDVFHRTGCVLDAQIGNVQK